MLLAEYTSTELRKNEVYMLWVASQTSFPAAKAKLIMLLPTCSVKACTKYQFLETSDEQCRSLCVQKSGTGGFYVLLVTRNSNKSYPEDFSWSSLLKKWRLSSGLAWPLWVYCCTRRWKSITSSVCDIWLCDEYPMLGAEPCPKTHYFQPWYWTLQS